MSRSSPGPGRIKSSLQPVRNDTGRTAFCGPYVLAALTGFPVSRVEDEVNRVRGLPSGSFIKGTHSGEVADAAAALGYDMTLVEDFGHLDRKERPTLWSWMQKPRNAWRHYLLAIHTGKDGHWILVKGVKICDTFTGGQWKFVCDGPHKGRKIYEVYEIAPSHGVVRPAEPAGNGEPPTLPALTPLAIAATAPAPQSFARST
jgi:hypothetical protein